MVKDTWGMVAVMAQMDNEDSSPIISGTLGYDELLISRQDLEGCIDRFLDDVISRISDSLNSSRQQ